ncbi:RHS repeat-associated core domain-containing protein [Aestuariicoccus sp. MJ-SS9]|uniref:RHS repeat-associated core domain-containing protein n=1 Tax=Aestuariicoccus sp. MJ-SS9 TaxID=3079855 RepID=UPI00290E238C|nr:RHS repeat-associated core domain-containing protein [Aestuariicoccus sp. MJ-SS9]MDU8913757.1 RHS repeat-associated core domain-containing protein [Aestuariicoccus sp. MJ-SS9]
MFRCPDTNTVHKVVANYDQASVERFANYSLSGEPQRHSRQFVSDWTQPADWSTPGSVPMDSAIWKSQAVYDSDGRTLDALTPNGSHVTYDLYRNGWIKAVHATPQGVTDTETVAGPILYAATGRVSEVDFGNGVHTTREFEPTTQHLTSIRTKGTSGEMLQDISYAYDPVGNVTNATNHLPIPGDPAKTSGASEYVYDSLYRLRSATGRAATGLSKEAGWAPPLVPVQDHAIETYAQAFDYDVATNLTSVNYQAASSTWQQKIAVSASSNHAIPDDMLTGGKTPDDYFDPSGNLVELRPEFALGYDYANNLQSWQTPSPKSLTATAQFSFSRNRLRKVELDGNGDGTETLYLDDTIITREVKDNKAKAIKAVSLQVMFSTRLALQMRWFGGAAVPVQQYQLEDRLTSVAARLKADGSLLDVQEFLPYGGEALWSSPAPVDDVQQTKRFRFTQQELDGSSGLYQIGARAYIPWLGRWSTPDPAGGVDGLNLFAYVRGNPMTDHDPSGTCGDNPTNSGFDFREMLKNIKYDAKALNALGVFGNGLLDSRVIALELKHKLALPYKPLDFTKVPSREFGSVARMIGTSMQSGAHLGLLTGLSGFTVIGGLSGMTYHTLGLATEGVKEKHVMGLAGNTLFTAEGVVLWKAAMTADHHVFHRLMPIAGGLGFAADTIKAISYYRQQDYYSSVMYGALGVGNGLSVLTAYAPKARFNVAQFLYGSIAADAFKSGLKSNIRNSGFARVMMMTNPLTWIAAGTVMSLAKTFEPMERLKRRYSTKDKE